MDDYIAKPLHFMDLKKLVQRRLAEIPHEKVRN
jgi:hypothetical protein